MTTAMYDAREAIIPGSVYDRSSQGEGPASVLLTFPRPLNLCHLLACRASGQHSLPDSLPVGTELVVLCPPQGSALLAPRSCDLCPHGLPTSSSGPWGPEVLVGKLSLVPEWSGGSVHVHPDQAGPVPRRALGFLTGPQALPPAVSPSTGLSLTAGAARGAPPPLLLAASCGGDCRTPPSPRTLCAAGLSPPRW
jgi:hypothetical protein